MSELKGLVVEGTGVNNHRTGGDLLSAFIRQILE
jgi:hypothetical protein